MALRPIIFVSAIDFLAHRSGLAARTKLMFDILTAAYPDNPKTLVLVEATPEGADRLRALGWTVVMAGIQRDTAAYKLGRLLKIASARFGIDPLGDLLWLRGGMRKVVRPIFKRVLRENADALVWIFRMDYAGLVDLRLPGQSWVIDTNDSTYHLQQAYGWKNVVARTLRWSPDAVLKAVGKLETRYLPKYDRVIAISSKDFSHFQRFVPSNRLWLYDTCIPLDEQAANAERPYFAGYLGADHAGSIECANELIRLFEGASFASLQLVIGGTCSAHVSSQAPNIKIVGTVPDSRVFWRSVKNVVLPGTQPTGISVKFQEALSCGCRVFINPNGFSWSKFSACEVLQEYRTPDELRARILVEPSSPSTQVYESIRFSRIRDEIAGILAPYLQANPRAESE